MDIKPPKLPTPPTPPIQPIPTPPMPDISKTFAPQPINTPPVKKIKKKKRLLAIIVSIFAIGIIIVTGMWFWYQMQLAPVNSNDNQKLLVNIPEETSTGDIATILHKKGLIKNEATFVWYTGQQGVQNQLQPGTYRLSPSESTPQIVEHLVNGRVDTFKITFYPGATLVDTKTKEKERIDVTSVLKKAGYSETEITSALKKQYNHPLFEGKPPTADLEGYIFGETYEFYSGVSVEDILMRTFDEFYTYVKQENLVAAYRERGFSLYQGITLASIVQRESGGDDKAQIAQVFYNRLASNMVLGSDVTYQYIADKEGGVRDPNYDSPYNTRRYKGLPPGPIAVPGLRALTAVATPAGGDYLFFLSGDDHVTYFARTLEEHEANIKNHCQVKCQII